MRLLSRAQIALTASRDALADLRLRGDNRWLRMVLWTAPSVALLTAHAVPHAWLCDDAFISFRYARNLVEGHGLVFNRGEYVEGYTNFLWVLELAALWKLFGLVPELGSVVLSALYTLGTLLLTARLAWTTPWPARRWMAVGGTLFLLAINRNVAVWTTSGLETRQFTFFVLLTVFALQRADARDAWRVYAPASLACALAELTRPEGLLSFACGGLWLVGSQLSLGRLRWRALAGYVLPFSIVVGCHYLWRHAYYGDWLPNTYYAKDVRPWPNAGVRYLTMAAIEGGLVVVLPLSALGLWARLKSRRDGLHVLCALLIVSHAAYLIRIGGDHFEFRPLDFYWPLLALATVDGLLALQAWTERWPLPSRRPGRASGRRVAGSAGWLVAAVVALLVSSYSTALQQAHTRIARRLKTRGETHMLYAKIKPTTLAAAFYLPGMPALASVYNRASKYCAAHSVGARHVEHRVFLEQQLDAYRPYYGHTRGLFPADAVTSMAAIGVPAYVLADLTIIDTLGLTDRVVAHNPVAAENEQRQLAHDRSPPAGYLKQRGVNLEVWPASARFGPDTDYALRLEDAVWMPLRSPAPMWLRAAFQRHGLWFKQLRSALSSNEVWRAGVPLAPVRALGFFDRGELDGWTLQGEATLEQPRGRATPSQLEVRGMIGTGLLDTYHPTQGDTATGNARSPEFIPDPDDVLVFLVGGGASREVGVELRVDGEVRGSWHGDNSENLVLVTEELRAVAGKRCQLHVFDESAGPWGHVLADHFMLMRSKAEPAARE